MCGAVIVRQHNHRNEYDVRQFGQINSKIFVAICVWNWRAHKLVRVCVRVRVSVIVVANFAHNGKRRSLTGGAKCGAPSVSELLL